MKAGSPNPKARLGCPRASYLHSDVANIVPIQKIDVVDPTDAEGQAVTLAEGRGHCLALWRCSCGRRRGLFPLGHNRARAHLGGIPRAGGPARSSKRFARSSPSACATNRVVQRSSVAHRASQTGLEKARAFAHLLGKQRRFAPGGGRRPREFQTVSRGDAVNARHRQTVRVFTNPIKSRCRLSWARRSRSRSTQEESSRAGDTLSARERRRHSGVQHHDGHSDTTAGPG